MTNKKTNLSNARLSPQHKAKVALGKPMVKLREVGATTNLSDAPLSPRLHAGVHVAASTSKNRNMRVSRDGPRRKAGATVEEINIQKEFTSHLLDKSKIKIIKNLPYSQAEALSRLNIYRNNVLGNFESILSENFKSVKNTLGEEKFQKILEKYYKKFPSKSGNVTDYVINFPKILKSVKPVYLADLAQLELIIHQSYFTKDVANFDVEKLKKIDAEKYKKLILELHPSCSLFSSKYPILSLYHNKTKKIAPSPQFILVYRKGSESLAINLSEEEFLFLSLAKKQQMLYSIFTKLSKASSKEIDIGKMLNNFIIKGVISNFRIAKK